VANLVKAINDKEGCALVGKIRVNQVPGEFHVSFHNYRGLWRDLNNRHKDLASKIKLSHSIKSLSLGDTKERIVKRFELDLNLSFRNFGSINTFSNNKFSTILFALNEIEYFL
jgi:hypothetical protein